jgi:diguanylate cyclase (GGDEF)-like protein
MNSHIDLFEAETAALTQAHNILASGNNTPENYRPALEALIGHYERLIRESRRLIARSDRTERELTTLNARLQQLTTELDYKAKHDNLTGVFNRGAIFDCAARYLQSDALSLIVLDIDFFKRINDEYGHPTGDAVIQELVVRLRFALDSLGEIGRVGGEEFTVLLPGCNLEKACEIAENLRLHIANKRFPCLPDRAVTASFGVSFSAAGTRFADAYACADAALYEAKRNGRNRVEHTKAIQEALLATE